MWKLVGFLLVFPAIAFAQLALKDQLPAWAAERFTSAAGQLQVEASGRINPFFQRGDFDGDGRPIPRQSLAIVSSVTLRCDSSETPLPSHTEQKAASARRKAITQGDARYGLTRG